MGALVYRADCLRATQPYAVTASAVADLHGLIGLLSASRTQNWGLKTSDSSTLQQDQLEFNTSYHQCQSSSKILSESNYNVKSCFTFKEQRWAALTSRNAFLRHCIRVLLLVPLYFSKPESNSKKLELPFNTHDDKAAR